MKKLLALLGLLPTVALAQPSTPLHLTQQFINNGTYLVVSNNYVWDYTSAPNTYYVSYTGDGNGSSIFSGAMGFTNSTTTNYLPRCVVDCSAWANPDGTPAQAAIQVMIGVATNYPLPDPLRAWNCGTNGLVSAGAATGVPTGIVAVNASATNYITFGFVKSCDGVNFDTNTATGLFQIGVQLKGTTPVCIATNVPVSFMTGAKKIRLQRMVTSDSTGSPGVTIDAINLNGPQ